MLKASALYIVIVIALVIGVICSSMIVAAYFYRNEYQRKQRYDSLADNLSSGINILLASPANAYKKEETSSLYGMDNDSVSLKRIGWGIYDIGIARAFVQKDTLIKVFSIAYELDSVKWAAIYLADEDRPLTLSGQTNITGNAFIPKAGVSGAYVDHTAYQGDKRLIAGKRNLSAKIVPALNDERLTQLKPYHLPDNHDVLTSDSTTASFLQPTRFIDFGKEAMVLKQKHISGNVVIFSDTTVTIDGSTTLKNILVFARAVVVRSGFRGNCQLFATDSIYIAGNCRFDYPSCLGMLDNERARMKNFQPKITIEAHTLFNGVVFTSEKAGNTLKPLITVGKDVKICGQVFTSGMLELKDRAAINGSVTATRFIYRTTATLFENYLINATINTKALSPYYLTSGLLPNNGRHQKILQWLDAN